MRSRRTLEYSCFQREASARVARAHSDRGSAGAWRTHHDAHHDLPPPRRADCTCARVVRVPTDRRRPPDPGILLPRHPGVSPGGREPGPRDPGASVRRGPAPVARTGRADRAGVSGPGGACDRAQHGGARHSPVARRPRVVAPDLESHHDRHAAPRLGPGRLRPSEAGPGLRAVAGAGSRDRRVPRRDPTRRQVGPPPGAASSRPTHLQRGRRPRAGRCLLAALAVL
jgi:hypothetical protein